MQRKIKWHEDCIANEKNELEKIEREIKRKMGEYNILTNEIEFYQKQVVEAKRRGLDCFDEDRFMKKRSEMKCKMCNGTGFLYISGISYPCADCMGSGEKKTKRSDEK